MSTPLYLFADTCVWLSLAQRAKAIPLLDCLSTYVNTGQLRVLAQPLLLEELDRNRQAIVDQHEKRLRTYVKHARQLSDLLDDTVAAQLDKVANEALTAIPLRAASIAHALHKTHDLLTSDHTILLTVTVEHRIAAADRALAQQAPFHRDKNSVADAIHMECFRTFVTSERMDGSAIFVTENTRDFCSPSQQNLVHDDYAEIFAEPRVGFSTNILRVAEQLGPLPDMDTNSSHVTVHSITDTDTCVDGEPHQFLDADGAYLRSRRGGLTWHLLCARCGRRFDTGEHWD